MPPAPVTFTGGIVGSSADLAVTNNGPSTSTEGNNVTYNLTVTNNGPTTATNVVLTDTLDANLNYVSATKSQGTSTRSGSVVTFSFGSISVGQTVTATVTAESIDSGHLTNAASVTSSLSDANLNNNTAGATAIVTDPAIVVTAPLITSSTTLTNQTVATFTHGIGVEPASSFVARINWGDGATSAGVVSLSGTTYSVTGSHTFAASGSHTIITTVVEVPSGPWSQVANLAPPSDLDTMELLSDGTVMAFTTTNAVYKLTPDSTGSYASGTWSQLASMSTARYQNTTNVLPDGRVLVIGGQNTNSGEIYDPVANTWSSVASLPESTLYNIPSMLMANGTVLVGSRVGPQTYIYNPATNTWAAGPTRLFNDQSFGEKWTKLSDGSILSYDIWTNVGEAQRLDPTTMTWVDSGTVPVTLGIQGKATGPSMLLPDGRVFLPGGMGAVDGNSNTAIYTPSSTPGGTGTWAAGPALPDGAGARFSSAALLPNGHMLFAVGNMPVHLFEFDPTAPIATSLTEVTPTTPDLSLQPMSVTRMLDLPSGQILFEGASNTSELDLYTPSGSPQSAWKPTITSVVANGNHYTLTGTQLNGLSTGASYSPAMEMDSNYPIVELKSTSGLVYFARTSNWSSTGVATGSTPVSTNFSLPASMPYGSYSLTVVANGIASSPVTFTGGVVGPSADLAVTNIGPSTSTEGNSVTYNLTVTNNGPSTATNVVLTDTLGANLNYVSATKSQGTVAHSGSVVTYSIGSVAVGQTVTATITAQATEDGNLINSAAVSSSRPDANLSNNTAIATTAVAEDTIVVSAPIIVSGKNQSNVTVATFAHASGVEPTSAFVATINWGDGSNSAGTITLSGSTYTVKGSHTYSQNGSRTVTATVVEPNGSGGSPKPSPRTGPGNAATTPVASAGGDASAAASLRDLILANMAGPIGTGAADWLAALANNLDGASTNPPPTPTPWMPCSSF